MLNWVLKQIFVKLIIKRILGFDKIPKETREKFWTHLEDYSIKLAGEVVKNGAEGLKK